MSRKRAPRGPMEAMPVLGDMAQEENARVRMAYLFLPLGGFILAVVAGVAAKGKPNPATTILFLGGIFAAVMVWAWRQGRRERLRYLTVAMLAAALMLSVSTAADQGKPEAKRTTAASLASEVNAGHTNAAQCLANLFSGRWEAQGCSAEAKKKPAKKKAKAKAKAARR